MLLVKVVVIVALAILVPVTFATLAMGCYSVYRAARCRKPGISWYRAVQSRNIIFRDELYTEAVQRWTRMHTRSLLLMLPLLSVVGVLMLMLNYLNANS